MDKGNVFQQAGRDSRTVSAQRSSHRPGRNTGLSFLEDDNGNKRSSLQMIGTSIEFIKVDRLDKEVPTEKEAVEVG